jgi:alkylated DNA repair dioxygenase AlkB
MNKKLQEDNYLLIEEFLHPELATELGLQFKKDCIARYIKSDSDVENAPAAYMYPSFAQLLFSKIFFMNDIVGEKLYPTYAYSRWYKSGAELKPHVDKQECEISVSLNLYGDQWPIFMTNSAGDPVEINLKPGDAVVYRGMRSKHWREKFQGTECVQVFLHYVRADGPNVLHAFDLQRIGMVQ